MSISILLLSVFNMHCAPVTVSGSLPSPSLLPLETIHFNDDVTISKRALLTEAYVKYYPNSRGI